MDEQPPPHYVRRVLDEDDTNEAHNIKKKTTSAEEAVKERHIVFTTDAGEQEQEKTKPERANCIAAQESDTENRRCQEEACSMEKAATTKRKPEKSHQSYGVQTRAYTTSPPPHEQKRENR